jgi:hypothetical protein
VSGAWVLQANPKLYDVDAALRALDAIWWRVPQYTGEISAGDVAVLWRSGNDAGIVGVGRFQSEPQQRAVGPDERRFMLGDEGDGSETRALVRVAPVPFVAKATVTSLSTMVEHPIVTGPMGTVFRLDAMQWEQLRPLLPEPPRVIAFGRSPLPRAFSWAQRAKSINPMPGGYDGHLTALRTLFQALAAQRPGVAELPTLIERLFDITPRRGGLVASFLRKVGLVADDAGVAVLTAWAEDWRQSGDDRLVIALLHSRVRFVGEMLAELSVPRTTSAMLAVANERYGMGWSTKAQIARRRGWLQSAGLVVADEEQRLHLTDRGAALLADLEVYVPGAAPERDRPAIDAPEVPPEAPVVDAVSPPPVGPVPLVEALVDELLSASTASADPARFERAIRDAFAFLGFRAEWLGGAGRTDVLLDAPLGKGYAYRVIVDAKSSGTAGVTDQQIDWVTFTEHKAKHSADHVAVVAANPTGSRLFGRATSFGVAVISAEQLGDLCRQHARAPLGLSTYRKLFSSGGAVGVESVAEEAEEWFRVASLARSVIAAMSEHSSRYGRLFARDLRLILDRAGPGDDADEAEIQQVLDTLASPLVGVVEGDGAAGYLLAMQPAVVVERVTALAALLGGPASDADDTG